MTVSKKKNFKTPDLEDMVRIFRECGLSPPREVMNGFWRFHQLLRERDAELDLTRLKAFESMVVKHYVDSAIVADLIDLPSPLLDIGTGPGFPGLPLKMVRPDLHVILAESRGKRLAFLEEAIELLDLKGVDIYPHKVTPAFPGRVEGVITRDLESIEKTLERASGFLGAGGRVIFMKGPAADPEITAALAAHGRTFTLTTDRAYSLGQTGLKRRLLVFKRTAGGVGPRKKEPESMIKEIASEANPNFKVWRKILEPRGIRKHGRGIISGLKNVREVLRDFPKSCVCVLGLEPEVPPDLRVETGNYYRLRPELFKQLDLFGTGSPLLVVRVPVMEQWTDGQWPAGCTLFVPFQDPVNVGGVIRSAAALGAVRVVLLEEAAHPFHPRALRASGGSVFRMPLLKGPSLEDLNPENAPLTTLDTRGIELDRYHFPETFGLLPGLEGPGLPDRFRLKNALTIPMEPGQESLNAAAAAAIVMYEWRRRKLKS